MTMKGSTATYEGQSSNAWATHSVYTRLDQETCRSCRPVFLREPAMKSEPWVFLRRFLDVTAQKVDEQLDAHFALEHHAARRAAVAGDHERREQHGLASAIAKVLERHLRAEHAQD